MPRPLHEPAPVDVLLVSPGTTAGWRRVDADFAAVLGELGLSVAVATSDFPIARHLRRTVLATDLAEAAAMRRALTKALHRHAPRAIVFSSPQAAMLQPSRRLRGATAVRFDEPAASNRRGFGAGLLHALERRSLGQVRLLLPAGIEPSEPALALGLDTPMVALPLPIEVPASTRPAAARERLVLAYAANPAKKGLDLIAAAWAEPPPGWRLVITGIDHDAGRRFLARRGIPEPAGAEWTGLVSPERYRELAARARIFVSASRHEDYGLAQLEALGAGLALVTVPASGVYPALALARELDPRLVAADATGPALAAALRAGTTLSDDERDAYAGRARELLRPHSRDELRRRLAGKVIPALLGTGGGPGGGPAGGPGRGLNGPLSRPA